MHSTPYDNNYILIAFVKNLFAGLEIIRYFHQGETSFFNKLNYFHNEYYKDNPTKKPTLEKFDDYLYRWAMEVWPRALEIFSKQIC